jgi:hypothetical protein
MKTITHRFNLLLFALTGLLFLFIISSCSSNVSLLNDTNFGGNQLPGNWKGAQPISVRYTSGFMSYTFIRSTDTLPSIIQIDEQGKVTGSIGNAAFSEAKVKKNRGALGRKFNLATDYVIKGKLIGFTFSGDSIPEKEISIPLELENGYLKGDIFMNRGLGIYPMGSLNLLKQDSF